MLTTVVIRGPRRSTAVAQQAVGGASAATSTVAVNNATVAYGGTPVIITLQAKDAGGTNITNGGLTITFGKGSGTSNGTISAVTDVGNGTYTATWTPSTIGTARTITATMNGATVTTTMPTITTTYGAFDVATSTLTLAAQSGPAGGSAVVATVQGKDGASNLRAAGGGTVVIAIATGGATCGATTDVGNGTYTASVTPNTIDTPRALSATYGGSAITTSMPTFEVTTAYTAPNVWESTFEDGTWGPRDQGPVNGWRKYDNSNGYWPQVPVNPALVNAFSLYGWHTAEGGDWCMEYALGSGGSCSRDFPTPLSQEVWCRHYFRITASFSLVSDQKYILFGGFGGLQISTAGIWFTSYASCGGKTVMIVPAATLIAGATQWHSLEIHWSKALPTVYLEFWIDGALFTHADGAALPYGDTCAYWLTNKLYYPTDNNLGATFPNTHICETTHGGTGTIWLDKFAVSTAGRIGP